MTDVSLLLTLGLAATDRSSGGVGSSADSIKCTFYIGLCPDHCELIRFKVGMMLDTTKLYSMVPV